MKGEQMQFPNPPSGPPIDNPFVDDNGTKWFWMSFAGMWTDTEPTDVERWNNIVNAMDDGVGAESPEYFDMVKRSRK